MLSAKQLHKNIISKIEAIYSENEASSIAFILMEYYGISKQKYALNEVVTLSEVELESKIQKLINNEPVQYVLSEGWFFNRKFYVDSSVLIPRPETEELCALIIRNCKLTNKSYKILDIGTGSGCIPITLKLELPDSSVSAIDISKEAIEIAKKNALSLNAEIDFFQYDILNDKIDLKQYDIVISNPPYVLNSEKELMKKNVLDNEPHLALFVDDDSPLIFYEKIIHLCVTNNVNHLYFEVNEAYAKNVNHLMVTNGFKNVYMQKDIHGKDRFVYGYFRVA